jgi:hypothetical protein
MLAKRTAVVVMVSAIALIGAGCGGDDDSSDATGAVSTPNAAAGTPTTTEETTVPASSAPLEIEACDVLTKDEIEDLATVAGVTAIQFTEQQPGSVSVPGRLTCKHVFKVVEVEGSGRSEIDAVVDTIISTERGGSEYDRLSQFGGAAAEVSGIGDKAVWLEDNGELLVLVGDRLVRIQPGMPGIMEETNRPVAEAVGKIVAERVS